MISTSFPLGSIDLSDLSRNGRGPKDLSVGIAIGNTALGQHGSLMTFSSGRLRDRLTSFSFGNIVAFSLAEAPAFDQLGLRELALPIEQFIDCAAQRGDDGLPLCRECRGDPLIDVGGSRRRFGRRTCRTSALFPPSLPLKAILLFGDLAPMAHVEDSTGGK